MIIDCPYTKTCTSFNGKCETCVNNANAKRDYYQPIPYQPWTWPIIWCTSGTSGCTSDYYIAVNTMQTQDSPKKEGEK